MAWDVDAEDGADIQAWHTIRQFYHAIGEKFCVLTGSSIWPATNSVYEFGVVGSITDTSMTDSSKDWSGFPAGCSGTSRWFEVTCTGDPNTAYTYDLIIEGGGTPGKQLASGLCGDETKVIRARITGGTTTSVTFADTINDYITAGIIADLSELVGKSYYIIKRDGLWWADQDDDLSRWPAWPNGYPSQVQIEDGAIGKQELWTGVVTSADELSLTDATDRLTNKNTPQENQPQHWGVDRWLGYELLVYGDDGYLHRVEITGNTANTLIFDVQTWIPTGDYLICEVGLRGFPGRIPGPAKWFYGGYQEYHYSHFPNDVNPPATVKMPVADILISTGNTEPCDDPELRPIFDIDFYIERDDLCADQGGDVLLAPHLFKTRRAVQQVIEGLVTNGNWADLVRYETNPAVEYVLATAFDQASINSRTTTISTVNNTTNVATIAAITMPRRTPAEALQTSMSGRFAIIDDDETVMLSGTGTFTETTFVSSTDLTDIYDGKEVVLSWGYTEYWPREFGRYYSATGFIPDVDTSESAAVIDPAEVVDLLVSGCFGVGQWIHREPSAAYQEYNTYGFAGDGGQEFLTNELARYVGSHWAQPDVGLGPSGTMTREIDADALDVPYYDHSFTVGKHLPAVQAIIDAAKSGQATGGGAGWLQDNTQDWYASVWYSPNGVMRTETGTAASGTTTSLIDTSKSDDVDFEPHCFWAASRFVNFAGAYVGFPIKISQTRSAVTTEYRSVITGSTLDSSQLEIQFRAVPGMPAIEVGDTYSIDEPYELNRWQERVLRITKADGTTLTTPILWSDDKTLFFDTDVEAEADDAYSIIEVPVGSVLKWDGGAWIEPTPGTGDSRGPTPGRGDDGIFVDPNSGDLPTCVVWYGYANNADYSGVQFPEMSRLLNLLKKTTHNPFAWTTCSCGEVEFCTDPGCTNDVSNTSDCPQQSAVTWSDVVAGVSSNYAPVSMPALATDFNPPLAGWAVTGNTGEVGGDVVHELFGSALRIRNHGYATGIKTCMLSSVEYWVYCEVWIDLMPEQNGFVGNTLTIRHFDANSDNVLYRAWSKIGASGADSTAERTGPSLGGSALPNTIADPTAPLVDGDHLDVIVGYIVTDQMTVIDWSPGMKFID